MQCFVLLST